MNAQQSAILAVLVSIATAEGHDGKYAELAKEDVVPFVPPYYVAEYTGRKDSITVLFSHSPNPVEVFATAKGSRVGCLPTISTYDESKNKLNAGDPTLAGTTLYAMAHSHLFKNSRGFRAPKEGKVRVASVCADKMPKNADPYNFVLQFHPSEIEGLVSRRLTNVDQDKAFQAGNSIANGNYSRDNLNVIVAWKMEGVHLTRVMSYLDQNTDAEIHHALRSTIEADTERSAIEILDRLHGVGVPVASAILTTINPETYTIIDIYALRSLGISDGPTDRVDYYLAYLRKCRELAQQFKISLRTLDHALWQWGYEHRR